MYYTGTMEANMNKPRIVEPDPADPAAGFREYPDGTVAFTKKGYARWKPRLAKLGINIDNVRTAEDLDVAFSLDLEAHKETDWANARLAAILTWDPVESARLEARARELDAKEKADVARAERLARFRVMG
ncbi:MAG: hypothetical protein ACYDHY_16985 [Acidiferrobacterales bacterium]